MLALGLGLGLVPELRRYAPGVLLAGAVVVGLVVAAVPSLGAAVLRVTRLSGGTATAGSDLVRATVGAQGLRDFRHSPIQGIGLQVSIEASQVYIQELAAGGLILFVGNVDLCVGGMVAAARLIRRYDLAAALLAALVVTLALNIFEADLTDRFYYVPAAILVALGYVAGLDARSAEEGQRVDVQQRRAPRRQGALMTETRGLRLAAYEAKRVAQTRRTFANWPALLARWSASRVGRGTDELHVRHPWRPAADAAPTCRARGCRCTSSSPTTATGCDWLLGAAADRAAAGARRRRAHRLVRHQSGHARPGRCGSSATSRRPRARATCAATSSRTAWPIASRVHECALAAEAGTALLDDNSGGSVHNGLVRADHRLVDGADALETPARDRGAPPRPSTRPSRPAPRRSTW